LGYGGNKMKYKVVVEGPALTQSGYGEHTRLVLRSLRAREDLLDVYLSPLNWGTTSWLLGNSEEREWLDTLQRKLQDLPENERKFDFHIRVGIPNEFNRLAPYAVTVTAGIETTKVAPKWIEKSHEMDRLVVPSEFAKWVFENTKYEVQNENGGKSLLGCGSPVDVVPYPVGSLEKDENFKLDLETDFNYLIVAQWSIRKNLENTLRWFIEEFKNEDIGLVIKTNTAKNSYMDRSFTKRKLEAFLGQKEFRDRKCRIYFLHGDMTREELNSLYTHPKIKAIISATHGEGFGLPLFEAACNGLPVLATGWSGHLDFLYAPVKTKGKGGKPKKKALFARVDYVLAPVQKEAVWKDIIQEGSMWSYPNKVDFKKKLRALYTNNGMYLSWAKKLKAHILKNYSEEEVLKRMLSAVIPSTLLNPPEYVYVSDAFAGQYQGGAEMSLQTIIENSPSKQIGAINSNLLNEKLISDNKGAKWIFGNIANMSPEIFELIQKHEIEYSFIEFDYKFCKHRNPLLYEMVESEKCDYGETELGKRIKTFVENAKSIFFMSEKQKQIYLESIGISDTSNVHVLSSLFGSEFFKVIESFKEQAKDKKKENWVVLGSDSWVKGAQESEEWCKKNKLEYEVLWGLKPIQFLEKLALSKGVCFKPGGLDTCPRFIIEAKLLGCELELNENVQHCEEEWFNKDYEEIVKYLKSRPSYFWENAFC